MFRRIYAIFRARNVEFIRDRSSLSWNILFPVLLMFGLSFVFSSGDRALYTVGVLQSGDAIDTTQHEYLDTRYFDFVVVNDRDAGFRKVERHQLDLLVEFGTPGHYWVNPDSAKGYFAELALLQSDTTKSIIKEQISGDAIRYVDWVLPGILGMKSWRRWRHVCCSSFVFPRSSMQERVSSWIREWKAAISRCLLLRLSGPLA